MLPTFTLSLVPMAYFARLVRGTMLETLETDYVRMARAKGLRARASSASMRCAIRFFP